MADRTVMGRADDIRQIEIAGAAVAIRIVRSRRARRWSLRYDARADMLRLSVPWRGALGPALDWVAGQQGFVARVRAGRAARVPFIDGAVIPFAGLDHPIRWQPDGPRRVVIADGALVVGGPVDGVPGRILRWLRREALATLSAETADFAALAGVSIRKVAIGDPRSRWGSCTADGAIRYSWRLILAPPEVRRATVAHEVAHRLHMDHSPDFHAAVARIFGRAPEAERRWLRQHGARLHHYGGAPDGAAPDGGIAG